MGGFWLIEENSEQEGRKRRGGSDGRGSKGRGKERTEKKDKSIFTTQRGSSCKVGNGGKGWEGLAVRGGPPLGSMDL